MNRRHFIHFSIAGFTFYDGPVAFKNLEIGSQLKLIYEPENNYDPKAVAIYSEDFKLGYIPRSDNSFVSKLLEMGYENIFETVVQSIDPTEHPESQVGVIVYLKPNPSK